MNAECPFRNTRMHQSILSIQLPNNVQLQLPPAQDSRSHRFTLGNFKQLVLQLCKRVFYFDEETSWALDKQQRIADEGMLCFLDPLQPSKQTVVKRKWKKQQLNSRRFHSSGKSHRFWLLFVFPQSPPPDGKVCQGLHRLCLSSALLWNLEIGLHLKDV